MLCHLGELETRAGRPEASFPWFEEAVATFERLLDDLPAHTTTRYSLSYTLAWRARAFEALERWEAARADWKRAIEFDDRDDPTLREGLARVEARL